MHANVTCAVHVSVSQSHHMVVVQVIYGDTDSIMIATNTVNMAEVMKLGEAAKVRLLVRWRSHC